MTFVLAIVPVSAGFGHWRIKTQLVNPPQQFGDSTTNLGAIIDVDWLMERLWFRRCFAAVSYVHIPTTFHLVWSDIDKPSQTIAALVGSTSFLGRDFHD